MIFNTFAYFILFLIPSSALFRLVGPKVRPWVCVLSGASFFVYFSITVMAGWVGAACLLIFVWESLISRLYKRGSFWCLVGVLASLAILGAFKYWNFVTGLLSAPLESNQFYWAGAFLPLGVSFFAFEFIHYAVDRYNDRVEKGTLGEYMAFIFFFRLWWPGRSNVSRISCLASGSPAATGRLTGIGASRASWWAW